MSSTILREATEEDFETLGFGTKKEPDWLYYVLEYKYLPTIRLVRIGDRQKHARMSNGRWYSWLLLCMDKDCYRTRCIGNYCTKHCIKCSTPGCEAAPRSRNGKCQKCGGKKRCLCGGITIPHSNNCVNCAPQDIADAHRTIVCAQSRKRMEDNAKHLLQNLRSRVRNALKGNIKSDRTKKLIGCSIEYLMAHIEYQFLPGMTWENMGKWHVDHIIPCDVFDMLKESHQRVCFNWINLQPLWGPDNIAKGKRIPDFVPIRLNNLIAEWVIEEGGDIPNYTPIGLNKMLEELAIED